MRGLPGGGHFARGALYQQEWWQQHWLRPGMVPNISGRLGRYTRPLSATVSVLLLLLLQVAVSGSLGSPLQLKLTDAEGHTAGEAAGAAAADAHTVQHTVQAPSSLDNPHNAASPIIRQGSI